MVLWSSSKFKVIVKAQCALSRSKGQTGELGNSLGESPVIAQPALPETFVEWTFNTQLARSSNTAVEMLTSSFYTPVWKTDVFCHGNVRLPVRLSVFSLGMTFFIMPWCTLFLAAIKQFHEWFSPSVRLSHLFHYGPILVSSWNFQELLPMTELMSTQKAKIRGQRSRSQRSKPNLAASGP